MMNNTNKVYHEYEKIVHEKIELQKKYKEYNHILHQKNKYYKQNRKKHEEKDKL